MDVVSACPLRVASLAWRARTGTWVLTVVCKATYRLEQNVSPLAEAREHPNEEDNHWDDDPRKSVYALGGLAAFSRRARPCRRGTCGYVWARSTRRSRCTATASTQKLSHNSIR